MHVRVALVAFAAVAACLGNEKRQDSNYQGYTGPLVPTFNISIPVDHFNESDARVYENRYWVNDTFYQPGGPVFFLDYGLGGISDEAAATWLAEINGTSSVMALAAQYHGLAILWEHRYYGRSLPIPFIQTDILSAEPEGAPQGWSYLTVEQALEDVVYFANNLQSGGYQHSTISALAPSNTPWIWLGAVWSGWRGAALRIRNPEIVHATWASSASVEAIYDGSTWFGAIERSLPSNCSTDVRAVVAHVDQILSGDPASQEYIDIQRYFYLAFAVVGFGSSSNNSLTSYNLSDADSSDPFQIADIMSFGFTGWASSYGPSLAQNVFCNYLESYNPSVQGNETQDAYISVLTNPGNSQPSAEGFLASHGNNLTLGVEAYAYAVGQYQNYVSTQLAPASGPESPPNTSIDVASGSYQILTQIGWTFASNPDNITIVSKFLNYTAYAAAIRRIYFSEATNASLPNEPDVETVNKYGGWQMNPSNVMFTNGEFDPWIAASVFSPEPGSPGNQVTTEVPACGQSPENGTRYGAIFPNAATSWDLQNIEAIYKFSVDDQGRLPQSAGYDLFTAALDVWLPCFNGSSGSGGNGNATVPATYGGDAPEKNRPTWTLVAVLLAALMAMVVM